MKLSRMGSGFSILLGSGGSMIYGAYTMIARVFLWQLWRASERVRGPGCNGSHGVGP